MRKVHILLRLPAAERRLMVEALCWVVLSRGALWLLPFRAWRGLHARVRDIIEWRPREPVWSAGRIIRAIEQTSRVVPRATCLTQALAAQLLLARYGHISTLRIGLAKKGRRELEGHAWLEGEDGTVWLGGPHLEHWTLMPSWDGR